MGGTCSSLHIKSVCSVLNVLGLGVWLQDWVFTQFCQVAARWLPGVLEGTSGVPSSDVHPGVSCSLGPAAVRSGEAQPGDPLRGQ